MITDNIYGGAGIGPVMGIIIWPSAVAYQDAICDPGALCDAELQSGTIDLDREGRPFLYSGTFTATFHVRSATRDVALRCYVRDYNKLERRYAAISELLSNVHSPTLSRTEYLAHGIRVNGVWWPAIKMDWVAGRPLTTRIEATLGDGDAIVDLAAQFREAVRSLGVLGVAHGDLQHGNMLEADGALRFIDYDAMFVPALTGLQQAAYGHRNYQHPRRLHARFDGRLDNFSSIVIYTALIALASEPALWGQFNDGDNVLFRAHDFVSDGRSGLFQRLLANNATRDLAGTLLDACRRPIDRIPTLEEAIEASSGTMPAPASLGHSTLRLRLPGFGMDGHEELPPAPAPQPSQDAGRPVRRPRFAWFAPPVALLLTTLVGLGIGAAIAGLPRHTPNIIAALATPAPAASVKPTEARASVQPRPAATIIPARVIRVPRAISTTSQLSAGASALVGAWQINEANAQVGSMVWAGGAALTHNGTLVLNTHKVFVAGQPATSCERATSLHAEIALGAARQTVPFQETNCSGTTSAGEIRVADFAADQRSFHGTFWENGVRLGDFVANKQ